MRSATGLLIGALALSACGGPSEPPAPEETSDRAQQEVEAKSAEPSRIFGAGNNNPYTVDITNVPVDPGSHHFMADITSQMGASNGNVAINTGDYNSSFVVAKPDTPRVDLAFDNCQDKPDTPAGLYDGPAHFTQVPVPAGAMPAKGTDGSLAIWSPSTDQMWEFWQVKKQGEGWSACWGGRIDKVSESNGTFQNPFGTSASGLVTVGSMISLAEAREGEIEHAMSIGLLSIAKSPIVVPANRTDGRSDSPSAPPMGTRLRLDPSVDVEKLDLPPLGKAVARAAQKYGFIVADTSHTVAIGAESGQYVEQETGKDPWNEILAGTPNYEVLENFPWDKVHVVQLGYAPAGVPGGIYDPEAEKATSNPSTAG